MIRPTKKTDIKIGWHLIDARGRVLGRLASELVPLLTGKRKPYFVRNLDCGDHVVVINAKDVVVTGKKEQEKFYYSYSGYPGGLKKVSLAQMRERFPERLIINAVSRMLPKNKLRQRWLKRLHVFGGGEHPYSDKIRNQRPETKTSEE